MLILKKSNESKKMKTIKFEDLKYFKTDKLEKELITKFFEYSEPIKIIIHLFFNF